jgi:hypothetical protein
LIERNAVTAGKEIKMADADLDAVIRQLAKQQYKSVMAAAKKRRDRYIGLAAKAKNGEAKARLKLIAKNTMEQATAAARRLQISADNAADSYARSMRNAAEAAPPPAKKPVAKPVKKTARKAAKKAKA